MLTFNWTALLRGNIDSLASVVQDGSDAAVSKTASLISEAGADVADGLVTAKDGVEGTTAFGPEQDAATEATQVDAI